MSDGIASDEYSYRDCLDDIYDEIWRPTRNGRRLTDAQKQMQRYFVASLMKMGNFPVPGAETAITSISADARTVVTRGFDSGSSVMTGTLVYSPTSGYEWFPRTVFNRGQMTQADIYAYLEQTLQLIKSRRSGSAASDRAHYDLLVKTIEYGIE